MGRTLGFIAVTTCLAAPLHAATLNDFTSYFAFGDSLTDDGKLGGLLDPPSFEGRFTNGLTYAEMIAQNFPVSENFALGGATAGPVNLNPLAPLAPQFATFPSQILSFQASDGFDAAGGNPLVSVLLGSNDIFQRVDDPTYDVTDTVDAVIDGIFDIAALGAFDDFILPFTPGAADLSAFGDLRREYNAYLLTQLPSLVAAGLNIYTPNLDVATLSILSNPDVFGVEFPTRFCAPTFFDSQDSENCTFVGTDTDGSPIYDLSLANAFGLADPVHPTTPVHTVWSATVVLSLATDLAPVPLPAGAWLLISALTGLGLRRRRKV